MKPSAPRHSPGLWHSLQSRLTLLSLLIFLTTAWSLSWYANLRLHRDMEQMLGQQQLATVALQAQEINHGITERIDTLEKVTRLVTPELMARPVALQQLLAERPALPGIFNGGYFVTDGNGTAIASMPLSAQRIGRNYSQRRHLQSALRQGQSKVSEVIPGPGLKSAMVAIAVPIRAADGQILGALVGVTDLGQPNFMDRMLSARYGLSGGYTLLDRASRTIVSATDKSRALEVLPATGVNPELDRYLAQVQGTAILNSPKGDELLASLADVPVAGWALSAELPTQEAFAPINNLTNNILLATLLASVLVAAATWLLLRHQLAPVYTVFNALRLQANSTEPLQPLPNHRRDEIGHLIDGFNQLLATLAQRAADLSDSQQQLTLVAHRLTQAQQIAHIGSWTLDLVTGVMHWSDEIYRIVKRDPQQFTPTYQAVLDMIHPDDRPAAARAYASSLKVRDPFQIEHRVCLPDGRIKWVQQSYHSEFDAGGRAVSSVGTVQDITERKLFEAALAESRDLLMTVIDAIPMRVFWKDPGLRYLGCNSAFARDAGKRSPAEMIGQDDYQMGWAAQADQYRADDQRVMSEGVPKLFYDEPQTTPDGQTLWLRTCKIPLKTSQGEGCGVLGLYEDISERKRDEALVRKLSLVAEQSPESVVITNLAAEIEYVNASFERTTGYSREQVLGQNPRLLSSGLTPPTVYQEMWGHLLQGQSWSGELRNRRRDGSLYFDLITMTPLRDASGQITHYVSTQENITEKKQVADELERHRHGLAELVRQRTSELTRAREQAEAANQAKSDFLANMSHEIRTPMNGVVGMVDVLRQTPLSPAQDRMLDTINQSSMALLGILNDILDFSKIEAGKLELDQSPTDLLSVIESTVQLLLSTARQKDVQLRLFVDPALPPWIVSDGLRLRQILLNLLGNAIKFTAAPQTSQVALHVQPMTRSDSSQWLELVVTDNGIGMTTDVVQQLFQPFQQADARTVRRFGGTGLGLSITQRLVHLMEGDIQVQSSPGHGSQFTVSLPLMQAVVPANQALPALADLHGVTVLAVAPELACQTILQVYLGAAGAQLRCWPDFDGVAAALAQQPDTSVLLLDRTPGGGMPESQLAPWRDDPRVLWLVSQPQDGVRGIEVQALPLLLRDLIDGVAMACGRRARPDVAGTTLLPGHRPAPSVAQAQQSGRLILMAEDNETNRDVIHQQLRLLGYAAEVAEDGVQALEMWQSGRYALLLTDCHMPRLDGYDLTRAIRRAESAGRRKPVIAITANAIGNEAQRCLDCGMDDYLSKPLRMAALDAMLAKWLPGSSAVPPAPAALPELPEPPVADPEAIWHLDTLVALVGNNPPTLARLLQKYLLNAREQASDIQRLLATNELAALGQVAHTLKSASRSTGALGLGALCQALELAGKAGDATRCTALVQQLPDALEAVARRINQRFSP